MNNFQNTITGQGELKNFYDDSTDYIGEALRKLRKKECKNKTFH